MGKLGNISGKDAVKVFQKLGWQQIGQVGSHVVMIKQGVRVNLSIPQHKELSTGTLRALIRSADLQRFQCRLVTHTYLSVRPEPVEGLMWFYGPPQTENGL